MKKPTAHVRPEPQYVPADERRVQGKALRDADPREVHGGWQAPKDRRDELFRQGRIKTALGS